MTCDEESQQRDDALASLDDVDRNWAAFPTHTMNKVGIINVQLGFLGAVAYQATLSSVVVLGWETVQVWPECCCYS